VTIPDIREILGASEGYARFMAHRLVKKGWFERLRPGLYQLVPAERGREGVADTNPLLGGDALVRPYFYSFGTACTHYGFTDQVFSEVYMVTQSRRRPEIVRGKRYIFVSVPEARFCGFSEVTVLGARVQMATAERALLDAIDRPRYAGGIGEVCRIVARGSEGVAWDALVELARRWSESALVQRLGYLLEINRTEVPSDAMAALRSLLRPGNKVVLGSRAKWGLRGRLARQWNVVENVPREVLVSNGDNRRRRMRFAREAPR
jgi:predicted transcriptional regulator of viral defense system